MTGSTSRGIGVIGAGVAGLHLGLYLRRHDIPVTVYSDRSIEEMGRGRMANTVAHHHTTVAREQALDIDHWPIDEYGYFCHHHYIGGPEPLRFPGAFKAPSRAIDYRVYLPRIATDLVERGGDIQERDITAADLERLSEEHDLLVAASGKGGLAELFALRKERMPYDRPMRRLCGGLYRGITYSDPKGVTMSIAPPHGELLEIPMWSHDGFVTALLFENVPGGATEVLADASHADDPDGFDRLVLDTLRTHHPSVFERVDPTSFGLTGPDDLVQGGLVPTIREDFARLDNGAHVIAIGDAHTVVDPVIGQGANAASYEAWELGAAITEEAAAVENPAYDERFCRAYAARRATRVEATFDWTNLMIGLPPADHLLQLLGTMATDPAMADEFTDNFNAPERQWDILATPERTQEFIARHGAG